MQPTDEPQTDDEDHGNFLLLMQRLGQRTGELHKALAKTTGDPAFDPAPVTPSDLNRWTESISHDLDRVMQTLQQYITPRQESQSAAQLRSLSERIIDLRTSIQERIDTLRSLQVTAVKSRHHGDYHLGQVLVAENDFVIIDFEGEPGRPLDERRGKHLALRDAAGLLRSLDYASQTALKQVTTDRPQDVDRLQPVTDTWRHLSGNAFLEGYEQAIQNCPVYPEDSETGKTLINLFMLEKVLYEIIYELNNRPDWAVIPLRGLLDLLAMHPSRSSQP